MSHVGIDRETRAQPADLGADPSLGRGVVVGLRGQTVEDVADHPPDVAELPDPEAPRRRRRETTRVGGPSRVFATLAGFSGGDVLGTVAITLSVQPQPLRRKP